MSNMSYCRFQNTLNDLRDCAHALDDFFNGEEVLSLEELDAARRMLDLIKEMAEVDSDELEDQNELNKLGDDFEDEDEDEPFSIVGRSITCPQCKCSQPVERVNAANMRHADPTETYTLKCGHTVI
jgi:hypothetical protein